MRIAIIKTLFAAMIVFLFQAAVFAQATVGETGATKPIQASESSTVISTTQAPQTRHLKIPAGTPIEIEAAYTVSSVNVRPYDFLSFRVLVPVKVDGVTLIEEKALVTGRVVEAKRGGRWGKAGKLSWIMVDVVAVDLSRVLVQPHNELPQGPDRIRGISHGGEVAAKAAILGAVFPPLAPMAVLSGAFKRGEDAILPQGKRFVVYVQKDTSVTVPSSAELLKMNTR